MIRLYTVSRSIGIPPPRDNNRLYLVNTLNNFIMSIKKCKTQCDLEVKQLRLQHRSCMKDRPPSKAMGWRLNCFLSGSSLQNKKEYCVCGDVYALFKQSVPTTLIFPDIER